MRVPGRRLTRVRVPYKCEVGEGTVRVLKRLGKRAGSGVPALNNIESGLHLEKERNLCFYRRLCGRKGGSSVIGRVGRSFPFVPSYMGEGRFVLWCLPFDT